MSKKRRVSYRLSKDEALVIAPVDFWIHTADWFNGMGDDETDAKVAAEWHNAAAHINQWLDRTQYTETEDSEL